MPSGQVPDPDADPAAGPRRRTPSTDVTRSLLDAALEILRTEGAGRLTVRAVAGRAGVAPMGVYSRFDGKTGLLEALFVQGFERLHTTMAAASGPDARSRLVAACHAYRSFAAANPHHYQLMFQPPARLEVGDGAFAVARATFAELEARTHDAMTAGAIRPGDRTETAQQIWNAVHGCVSLELSGIGFTPDSTATFAATLETLLTGLSA
ncbi:MAG: TetR/AcrR family transcriptional regulator [Actinobacteria bacterium]|nr:TetR/AcrR family transcriptional regulator [Actinomycetota bacterium]